MTKDGSNRAARYLERLIYQVKVVPSGPPLGNLTHDDMLMWITLDRQMKQLREELALKYPDLRDLWNATKGRGEREWDEHWMPSPLYVDAWQQSYEEHVEGRRDLEAFLGRLLERCAKLSDAEVDAILDVESSLQWMQLSDRKRRILGIAATTPGLSGKEIASKLGGAVTVGHIGRDLSELKRLGFLTSSRATGYRVVKLPENAPADLQQAIQR